MNIKKITFFNHWRNGDCFINREYVKEIINHFKGQGIEFEYAHNNHRSILQDLECKQLIIDNIPTHVHYNIRLAFDTNTSTLYINSWVGCYIGEYFPIGEHVNFVILHKIWAAIFNAIGITMTKSFDQYFPVIDYSKFDLNQANDYINRIQGKPMVLICNGVQQSGQSNFGDMHGVVDELSSRYPNHEFLVCHPLNIEKPNVTYTDYLFGAPYGNLVQISYLSQRAYIIVGKNSGPFSYSHLQANINNHDRTFICFSTSMTSCLLGQGKFFCNSFFSDTIDTGLATELISQFVNYRPSFPVLKPTFALGEAPGLVKF
jgi:hypothetical protein